LIDLASRHVGCLAPAPLAALARGDGAGEGLFEEAADSLAIFAAMRLASSRRPGLPVGRKGG